MPGADQRPGASLAGVHMVVLAAGRGRRMGGPKALMTVRGQPWWRHQAQALDAAGLMSIWVVSPDVHAALAAPERGAPPPPTTLADPDAPMFESLRVGVRALASGASRPDALLILPVDVPLAGPETLARLVAHTRATRAAAAPSYRSAHGHPLCVHWRWAEAILTAAGESARLDLLVASSVEYIEVDDPLVALNLNTPADLAAFEQMRP